MTRFYSFDLASLMFMAFFVLLDAQVFAMLPSRNPSPQDNPNVSARSSSTHRLSTPAIRTPQPPSLSNRQAATSSQRAQLYSLPPLPASCTPTPSPGLTNRPTRAPEDSAPSSSSHCSLPFLPLLRGTALPRRVLSSLVPTLKHPLIYIA